jgi:outer membrane protein assembly factor BamB
MKEISLIILTMFLGGLLVFPQEGEKALQKEGKIVHTEGCPESCKRCQDMFKDAISYFKKNVFRLPRREVVVSQEEVGHYIGMAIGGLVLLSSLKEDDKKGRKIIRKITRRLRKFIVNARGLITQANWTIGMISLYFAELHLRGEDQSRYIKKLVRLIERSQNKEGGWGHGKVVMAVLPSYPVTLVACTNWCAIGLGLFKKMGFSVKKRVIRRVIKLYEKLQSPEGGFPYGGLPYRTGYEAGRTTGGVIALFALGRTSTPLFSKTVRFINNNVQDIPKGHATPQMHLFSGSIAFYLLGKALWKRYYNRFRDLFIDLQEKNGRFRNIRPISTRRIVLSLPLFTHSLIMASLSPGRFKFIERLREGFRKADLPSLEPEKIETARLKKIWNPGSGNITSFHLQDQRVYIATDSGGIYCVELPSGKKIWQRKFNDKWDISAITSSDQKIFLALRSKRQNIEVVAGVAASLEKIKIRVLDIATGKKVQKEKKLRLPGGVVPYMSVYEGYVYLSMGGVIYSLRADDMKRMWKRRMRGSILSKVKGGRIEIDRGSIYIAQGEYLYCLDKDKGRKVWRFKMRKSTSLPMINSFTVGEESIIVTSTEGKLYLLQRARGGLLWEFQTGSAFGGCSAPILSEKRLYAVNEGGTLYSLDLRSGKELWRFHTYATGSNKFVISRDGMIYILAKKLLYKVTMEGKLLKKTRLDLEAEGSEIRVILKDDTLYIFTPEEIYRLEGG